MWHSGLMVDATMWMPKGMDYGEKAEHAAANPDNPHGAAADAWESWSAQLRSRDAASLGAEPPTTVASVSTGAQSVSYSEPKDSAALALLEATWHRARARAYSVRVGPSVTYEREEAGPPRAGDPLRPEWVDDPPLT